MANEAALAHLKACNAHLLDALAHIKAVEEELGAPPTEPPPTEPGTYELKTVGRTWLLEGEVSDWKDALVFPPMEGLAGFSRAEIAMTIEVGPDFAGLHNFIYLTENAGRWLGDVVLMVVRGVHGAITVSNTLSGGEVHVRDPWPLVPGRIDVVARLANGMWAVSGGPGVLVQMSTPPLTSARLVLQLGNSSKDGADHPTNAGWKLLTLTGSVS